MFSKFFYGQWTDIDPRSLRFFRVLLGLCVIAYAGEMFLNLDFFFTDAGVFSRWYFIFSKARAWTTFGPYFWLGEWWWAAFLILTLAASGGLLILGPFPRFTSAFIFLQLVFIRHRAPHIEYGADNLLVVVTLWSSLISTSMARHAVWIRGLFVLQVAWIYLVAGWTKSTDSWLWSPVAVDLALRGDRLVSPLGRALLEWPWLTSTGSVATLLWERFAPLAFLLPKRMVWGRSLLVVGFIFMHFAFDLSLHLGLFSWIAVALWSVFIPSFWWDRLGIYWSNGADPAHADCVQSTAMGLSLIGLAILILSLGLYSQYCDLGGKKSLCDQHRVSFLKTIGLRQSWRFFAPTPFRNDGWFYVEAVDVAGRRVGPIDFHARPMPEGKPQAFLELYPTYRWTNLLQYVTPIQRIPDLNIARQVARFLCGHLGQSLGISLNKLSLFFVLEYSQVSYNETVAAPAKIVEEPCPRSE